MTHGESWHARKLPAIGSRVCDKVDPRHVGRLEAILWSTTARIRFENGWWTDLPVDRLQRAEGE